MRAGMKWLCVVFVVAGCEMYFDSGSPPPPDAIHISHDSGSRTCPAELPEASELCGHHHYGLTCTYPADDAPYTICRCNLGTPAYRWECAEARFDAGVDAP
jgi:hypothetical protein